MTRPSSTTTRPHSLPPVDTYCHTLDWARCTLQGGEGEGGGRGGDQEREEGGERRDESGERGRGEGRGGRRERGERERGRHFRGPEGGAHACQGWVEGELAWRVGVSPSLQGP